MMQPTKEQQEYCKEDAEHSFRIWQLMPVLEVRPIGETEQRIWMDLPPRKVRR